MALAKRNNNNEVKKAMTKFEKDIDVKDLKSIEATIGLIPLVDNERIEAAMSEKQLNDNDELTLEEKTVSLDNYEMISIDDLFAAPKEWNLWDAHSPERKLELMESIYQFGLLQNIIVWKIPQNVKPYYNGEALYMILAGHNRVDACRKIKHITSENRFNDVPALVYDGEMLNEGIAKRIIDDTNLLSRDKTPKEIGMAYIRRMTTKLSDDEYKKVSKRQLMEMLATEDGKSRTHIYNHIQLANCIDDISNLVGTVISLKAGVSASQLSEEKQQFIYDHYYMDEQKRFLFCNSRIVKLKPLMLIETIKKVMDNVPKHDLIKVSYEIKPEIKESLDNFVKKLIEANNI